MDRKLKKAIGWASGTIALLVGLIGVAHTPVGRPLLGLLGRGCPLDRVDPAAVERHRQAQLAAIAGEAEAAGAPALGFELGVATKADVKAWIAKTGARCSEERQGSVIKCTEASVCDGQAKLLPLADVHLQFDGQDRLVTVDLYRLQSEPSLAVDHVNGVTARLDREVGPATGRLGSLDAGYLAGTLHQASIEYRYRHYQAEIRATNFGHGVKVREQYQWLPG